MQCKAESRADANVMTQLFERGNVVLTCHGSKRTILVATEINKEPCKLAAWLPASLYSGDSRHEWKDAVTAPWLFANRLAPTSGVRKAARA